jgi:hypothetical protein
MPAFSFWGPSMPARKHVAPELIAQGKYFYEQTLTPTDEIGAKMGLSRSAFYLRVKEWNWKRRRYSSGGIEAEQAAAVSATAASEPVVAQEAAEKLPAEPPVAFAERLHRTTRVLATISRTVQEIVATAQGRTPDDEADDDPVPSDIDEFRFELARRIRGFIDARRNGAVRISGEPETPLD